MKDLTVEIATEQDIDNVSTMFDLYRQFYDQDPDLALAKTFISSRIQRAESVILIAKHNDIALGFCQLYPSFCSVGAIDIYILYDLYVKPEHRGNGVAKILMKAAEQHAIDNGMKRLELATAKDNHSAQKLYESLSWVKDREFFNYSKEINE